jgi:hypothetical protein
MARRPSPRCRLGPPRRRTERTRPRPAQPRTCPRRTPCTSRRPPRRTCPPRRCRSSRRPRRLCPRRRSSTRPSPTWRRGQRRRGHTRWNRLTPSPARMSQPRSSCKQLRRQRPGRFQIGRAHV